MFELTKETSKIFTDDELKSAYKLIAMDEMESSFVDNYYVFDEKTKFKIDIERNQPDINNVLISARIYRGL